MLFEFYEYPHSLRHVLKTNSDMVADRRIGRTYKGFAQKPCTIIKIATRYAAFVRFC